MIPYQRPAEMAPQPAECEHAPGRVFHDQIVREMLRALGIVTCDRCHQALAILGRRR